jgi:hypothetical protein
MAPTALGLRYLGVVLLAAAALGGCGESYRLDPACLNIVGTTAESKEQLLAVVSRLLGQEGFEAFGKSEEMIALMQQADFPDTVREEQLARLNRGFSPGRKWRSLGGRRGTKSREAAPFALRQR